MTSNKRSSADTHLGHSTPNAIALVVDATRRASFTQVLLDICPVADIHVVEQVGELPTSLRVRLVISDRGLEKSEQDVMGQLPVLVARDPDDLRAALNLAEPFAARALASLDEAVEVVGPQGTIRYVNPAFERVNRHSSDAALGRASAELFANDFDDGRAYESAAEALAVGQSWRGPLVARRGDGALIHQEMTVSPITDAHGTLSGSICLRRDISRQVRSEGALRESERRYRLLAENANDVIWTAGLDGLLEYCSPSVKRVLGYSVEEALDLGIDDFLPSSLTTDEREDGQSADTLEWLHQSGVMTYQAPQRRRDGQELWVETQVSPLRDGSGEMVGVLGVTRDITRRRQAEAERASLEAQLQQAQKMEAIGRLAGGIAHDFNNILTGMTVSAQLLLDSTGLEDQHRDDIHDIKGAAERATRLTRQLMAFSRTQVISPEVLVVNDVVSSFERMLSRLIGEDVRMQ
ncbi:MAG: PAS domain S-box protein, partial [Myxococcota bacterium]|nr:PAS domain S-box protein [Myxococcota bacterium]